MVNTQIEPRPASGHLDRGPSPSSWRRPWPAGDSAGNVVLALLGTVLIKASLPLSVHAAITPVAWYRLGENDGGVVSGQAAKTTTTDFIGSNDLRRIGSARYTNDIPPAAQQIGSTLAVVFSGAGFYTNSVVASTARNNFGIEAWVRTLTEVDGTYVVAHNGNAGANGWGLQAVVSTGPLGEPFVAYSGRFGGGGAIGGGAARRAGAWTHVALVRDNGTNRFYLNGTPSGSASTTTPLLPAGGFVIAGLPALVGVMDETRVFTFAPGQFSTDDLLVNQDRAVTQSAIDITTNSATLRGSASSFSFATTAWFEWGPTPGLGNVTSPVSFGSDFATTNFTATLSGLPGGDTFFFRTVASNTLGIAFGATLSFTTPMAPGQGGFALGFDGTNDFVEVSNDSRFNAFPLIASAWIKTTQATGEAGLINKYVAGSSNGWNVGLVNGAVRAWYVRSATNHVWDGGFGLNGGAVNDGQWHHVAFTVNESGGFLYVDGTIQDARGWTGPSGPCSTSEVLKFGRYPGGAGEFYKGVLDEVVIGQFGDQSQGQIQTNMNRGLLGTELGLVAYHRFNAGTGTFAENAATSSGIFGSGSLRNGVQWVPGIVLRPAIETRPATAIQNESARLEGAANPGLTNTSAWFEWGATPAYGNATPAQFLGAGGTNRLFRQVITGLTENATYHFRAVASNALGASFGIDRSFAATGTNMITPRVQHTATLLPNGKVLVTGGRDQDNRPVAAAELFDPATGRWSPTTSMIAARFNHTASVLPNGRVLVAGGESSAELLSGAELYDPVSGTWAPTGPLRTNRSAHTATLLANGKVLVAGGQLFSSLAATTELYDPASGTWTPTGPLATPRYLHTATLLRDGTVLVAGGVSTNGTRATAEVYEPTTGSWTSTGSMTTNRHAHTATLLRDGAVLVTGGLSVSPSSFHRSAELYSPSTGTWTNTTPMLNDRYQHTATLLLDGRVFACGLGGGGPSIYDPNLETWTEVLGPGPGAAATATLLPSGNVLVTGGFFIGRAVADAEVFVVTNRGAWFQAPSMALGRSDHTATMLADGRVLVAGTGDSDIYGAIGGRSDAAPLNTPRGGHRATLLGSGQVLVSGGYSNSFEGLRGAELFDPSGSNWVNTGAMNTPRGSHTATLLPDGRVLVTGGLTNSLFSVSALSSSELFDPATQTWSDTGAMTSNRVRHTATLLPNGKVLVTGGVSGADLGAPMASAELYNPATGSWTLTGPMHHGRADHTATLLPSGLVLVAGGVSNTFTPSIASAELYDPVTGTWTETDAMSTGRWLHTATLLANGQVLAARGYNLGYLSSAELYDPVTRTWSVTTNSGLAAFASTATLLVNGRVLLAGGWTGSNAIPAAELFELRQGFVPLFRPRITEALSPLSLGGNLVLAGVQFRALSEGTGGNGAQSSPVDHPVVQLRRLDNEQIRYVAAAAWSPTNFISAPLLDFPHGPVMVTVFAGGIPGIGAVVNVTVPPPLIINPGSATIVDGPFQFGFLAASNATFTVLGSADIRVAPTNWTVLGAAVEIAPGHYGFSDPQPPNQPQRFYLLRSP